MRRNESSTLTSFPVRFSSFFPEWFSVNAPPLPERSSFFSSIVKPIRFTIRVIGMELEECVFLHLVRRYFRFIRSLSFVERQDRQLDRPPFHRRNRGYSSSASHHYQMFFLSLDYSLFFLRTCVYIHTYTQLVYAYTHRFFIYPSLTRSFALSPTNGPPHSFFFRFLISSLQAWLSSPQPATPKTTLILATKRNTVSSQRSFHRSAHALLHAT